jgi:type III restriction enzyme
MDFVVPILCVNEGGNLFEFEKTFLLEHVWKLSEKDASLPTDYDPRKRPAGQAGTVDLAASGVIETSVAVPTPESDFVSALHQQVLALGSGSDWTVESLVAWLDRNIEHQDIPAGESAEFLRRCIRGLMAKQGIEDLSVLALDRFRLRDAVEQRIREHRDAERSGAFKQFLLPGSPLDVSDERTVNFKTMRYEPSWNYEGSFRFPKHYFGPKPGELRERKQSGELAEEFLCAQYLEYMPEVEFWVRNLSRKSTSFRLQTSSDWFYPDFLCRLKDGRVLAVEYKGSYLYTAADAEEKRAVGAVWASRSNGNCLFIMPTDGDFSFIAELIKH